MFSDCKRYLRVCLCIAALCAVAIFPALVHAETGALTSQRVVLMEDFTGTWCPNCGDISSYLDEIWNTYGPTKLAFVAYHEDENEQTTDPYQCPDSIARKNYYGSNIPGFPTVLWDGKKMLQGGFPKTEYVKMIDYRLNFTSSFEITVTGNLANGNIVVHLNQKSSTYAVSPTMQYMLVENGISYPSGTEWDGVYDHVLRKTLDPDSISLPVPSGGADFTKSFVIDSSWNPDKMSFVAFIQNGSSKEIFQSCYYGYGGLAIPEINLLLIIPMGGLFVAVLVIAKRKGKDE